MDHPSEGAQIEWCYLAHALVDPKVWINLCVVADIGNRSRQIWVEHGLGARLISEENHLGDFTP
jgi:hypothetical protein